MSETRTVEQVSPRTTSIILAGLIVLGMAGVVGLSRWMEANTLDRSARYAETDLYLNPTAARRLSLGFNGLVADWYWMRSLQYMGRKVVNYQDTTNARLDISDLRMLNLKLLPPLLRVSTALDPQFMAPYQFGGTVLTTFDTGAALELLEYGIQQNPNEWRLYQQLGYIHWQTQNYQKSSEVYLKGGSLPGAPRWMSEMGARVAAEGGSRKAAREIYQHLYEEAKDRDSKALLARRLMQVDSYEEREVIGKVLDAFAKRSGRCVSSWKEITGALQALGLRVDRASGAPVDPAGTAYLLTEGGCKVDLDWRSQVPYK